VLDRAGQAVLGPADGPQPLVDAEVDGDLGDRSVGEDDPAVARPRLDA